MKGLLFTYIMTLAGTAAGLIWPFTGLLVYVCFAILKPNSLWSFAISSGNFSRVIFFGMFIGWVLGGFGRGKTRWGGVVFQCASLGFYLVWSAISATNASDQASALAETEQTAKIVLPFLIGVSLINSMTQLRQLIWVIVISQGYLALEFNRSYYDGTNRLLAEGFAGMDDKSVAITMVIGAGLALFLGVGAKRPSVKALAFVLAALMIHVPLFTMSRGGMLALLATGMIAVWLVPKRPVHILMVVCAIALGLRLAGNEVRQQFWTSFADEEERDSSAQSRVLLWGQAWETMLEKPVLGVGPRQWGAWAQSRYEWGSQKEAHSTWFQAGAELGFPGVLALAGFFVVTAVRLVPVARARGVARDSEESNVARMVICALSGYLVASQFVTVYGVEVPYYVALIGTGLLKLRFVRARETVAEAAAPVRPIAPALLGARLAPRQSAGWRISQ